MEEIITGYKMLLIAILGGVRPRKVNPEIQKEVLISQCNQILGTLSKRTEMVIKLRFGLGDGRLRTLEEVGGEFKVTRERIRGIESKGLRQLRHPSRSKYLREFIIPATEEEWEELRAELRKLEEVSRWEREKAGMLKQLENISRKGPIRMDEREVLYELLLKAAIHYHHSEATRTQTWFALSGGGVDALPRLKEAVETSQIKQIKGIGPKRMAFIQDAFRIAEEQYPE